MLEKQACFNYRHIENTKIYDLINRVCHSFESVVWQMYSQALDILYSVVFAIGIMVTLLSQVWWIGVLMTVVNIPMMYIAAKAGQNTYKEYKEMGEIDCKANYLSNILIKREVVEERNVFGFSAYLNNKYSEKFNFSRLFKMRVQLNNLLKLKAGGVITTIFSILTMLALFPLAISGEIDFGMFVGLTGAVFVLTNQFSWRVNWMVSETTKWREYLKDLTEFISLDEQENAIAVPISNMVFNVIEFKNVSFKYPDTEKLILDNISFRIEYGKHYSFVGVNGAGKTTIINLLTGLYSNYTGAILIDGRSLCEHSQSEIKGLVSVVYQNFAKYYISFYDNIAVSDLSIYGSCCETKKLLLC